ncbi:hypothetical protein GMAR_ORF117 [Golden Marseillevirus]|uniref:hypothetical protein n=1 Tax=Golden Marseillevirus TaxID=1720526 RepID=UPI000877AA1D|nr:hypothetical protein GMAR_ORF117 [Golden Marseillevirus]ALX27491.1 hypothetical protein GMAR_ORF117 [Golden Marseillevirus]
MEFAGARKTSSKYTGRRPNLVSLEKIREDLNQRKTASAQEIKFVTKKYSLTQEKISSIASGVAMTKKLEALFSSDAADSSRIKQEILQNFTAPEVSQISGIVPVYSQAYINQYFLYLQEEEKKSQLKRALVKKGILLSFAALTTGVGYAYFVSDPEFCLKVVGRFLPEEWVARIESSPELCALKVLSFLVPIATQGVVTSTLNQIVQGHDVRIFLLSEVSSVAKDGLVGSLNLLNGSLSFTGNLQAPLSVNSQFLELFGTVVSRTAVSTISDLAEGTRDFWLRYEKSGDLVSEMALQTLQNNLEFERQLESLTQKYKTNTDFVGMLKKQKKNMGDKTRLVSKINWYLSQIATVPVALAKRYKYILVGLLAILACSQYALKYVGFNMFDIMTREKLETFAKHSVSGATTVLSSFFDHLKKDGLQTLDSVLSLAKKVFTPDMLAQQGLSALETRLIPFWFTWLWIKKLAVPQRITRFLKKYPFFRQKFQFKFLKQALEKFFGQQLEWDLAYYQVFEWFFGSVSVNTMSSLVQNSFSRTKLSALIERLDFSTFGLFYSAAQDTASTLWEQGPDQFWEKISLDYFFPQFAQTLSRFAPGSSLFDQKGNELFQIVDIQGLNVLLKDTKGQETLQSILQLPQVFDSEKKEIDFSDALNATLAFSSEKEGVMEQAVKAGYTQKMFERDTAVLREKAKEIRDSIQDKQYREFVARKRDAESIQETMRMKLQDIDTLMSLGRGEVVSSDPKKTRDELYQKIVANQQTLDFLRDSQIKILETQQKLLQELDRTWEKYLESVHFEAKRSISRQVSFQKPQVEFSSIEILQKDAVSQKEGYLANAEKEAKNSVFVKQNTALRTKTELEQQKKYLLSQKISQSQTQTLKRQLSAFVSNTLSSSKFDQLVDVLLALSFSTNIDSLNFSEAEISLLGDALADFDRQKEETERLFDKLDLDKDALVCYNTSEYDWDLTEGYAISRETGQRDKKYDACFSDSLFPKVYNFVQQKAPNLISNSILLTNPVVGSLLKLPLSFASGVLSSVPFSYARVAEADDGTDDVTKAILLFIEVQCASSPDSTACKAANVQKRARQEATTNSKYRTVDILQTLVKTKDENLQNVLKSLFSSGEKSEEVAFGAYNILLSSGFKGSLNDILFGAEGISTLRMAYSEWEKKYQESWYYRNLLTEDAYDRQKISDSGLLFLALFDPIYLSRVSAAFGTMVGVTDFASSLLGGAKESASNFVDAAVDSLSSIFGFSDQDSKVFAKSADELESRGYFQEGEESAPLLAGIYDAFDGAVNFFSWS